MAQYSSQPSDELPPDSWQALVNQANLQQQAPPAPAPMMSVGAPAAVEMPAPAPAPEQDPKKLLPALHTYIAQDPQMQGLMNQYAAKSQESMNEQKSGLNQLGEYINNIAQKPQGINWSPLAAYVDAQNPNSHLADAARAMAPMSGEQRDQMVYDLRSKLQSGRNDLTKQNLSAISDQIKMSQEQKKMAYDKLHMDNQDQAALNRAMNPSPAVGVRMDNQTAAAVDKVVNDKQLAGHSTRIQGADRILNQLEAVKSGKITDTNQLLNDLNTEYVNLLTGSNSPALGKLERTEYKTALGDFAALKQKWTANPQSINSPAILQQLQKSVIELRGAYNRAYDIRAQSLARIYAHNPDATKQQRDKINEMRGHFGEGGRLAEDGAHSDGELVVHDGVTYKMVGDEWVEQ